MKIFCIMRNPYVFWHVKSCLGEQITINTNCNLNDTNATEILALYVARLLTACDYTDNQWSLNAFCFLWWRPPTNRVTKMWNNDIKIDYIILFFVKAMHAKGQWGYFLWNVFCYLANFTYDLEVRCSWYCHIVSLYSCKRPVHHMVRIESTGWTGTQCVFSEMPSAALMKNSNFISTEILLAWLAWSTSTHPSHLITRTTTNQQTVRLCEMFTRDILQK